MSTLWKEIIIIGFIIIFVFSVIFLVGSIVYTERPEFCKSCHLMVPYYDAWKNSPHKDVNCLECHYEPNLKAHFKGKIDGLVQMIDYITGRYSEKPVANISDNACLKSGCHDLAELKKKKIMFKDKVKFSHQTHFVDHDELAPGVQLKCTSCHTWKTYDQHMAVDENNCLICHFKSVPVSKITSQCLSCHTEVRQTEGHKEYMQNGVHCADCHTNIKTTDAPVLKQMCYFCHADNKKINKANDRELMHKSHIPKNSADCMNCHELIEQGKE